MGGLACLPPVLAVLALSRFGEAVRAPWAMFAILAAFHALVAACVIWHGVGVWRAARRAGWRAAWAARGLVLLAGAGVGGLLALSLALQMPEAWNAWRDDPDWPATSVGTRDNGRVITVAGPLRWSVVASLRDMLAAHPTARIIELDSPGGRVSTGLELHDVIQAHKLETLVRTACVSACTDAYLAGNRRWAGPSARLGFHQGAVGGATARAIDNASARIYREAGLDPAFITRVLTGGTGLWFPTMDELRAGNVVTDIATPGTWPLD